MRASALLISRASCPRDSSLFQVGQCPRRPSPSLRRGQPAVRLLSLPSRSFRAQSSVRHRGIRAPGSRGNCKDGRFEGPNACDAGRRSETPGASLHGFRTASGGFRMRAKPAGGDGRLSTARSVMPAAEMAPFLPHFRPAVGISRWALWEFYGFHFLPWGSVLRLRTRALQGSGGIGNFQVAGDKSFFRQK